MSRAMPKSQVCIKNSFKACTISENVPPLPYLVHAVNLLNFSLSKNLKNDCLASAALQGFIFIMTYFYKNGGMTSMEACYNVGRFFHGYGMSTYAVTFYRACLNLSNQTMTSKPNDLFREAAHNLALIYDASGNRDLANNILKMYLTI
ncbi:hypothetical protein HZS_6182 [Henneguya salminicola]|nr:hypothetical protein HZS_6182 [Henneguya salminicola]